MGWQSKILIKSLRRLALFLIVTIVLKKGDFGWAYYDLKSHNKTSPNFLPKYAKVRRNFDNMDKNQLHDAFRTKRILKLAFQNLTFVMDIWENSLIIIL